MRRHPMNGTKPYRTENVHTEAMTTDAKRLVIMALYLRGATMARYLSKLTAPMFATELNMSVTVTEIVTRQYCRSWRDCPYVFEMTMSGITRTPMSKSPNARLAMNALVTLRSRRLEATARRTKRLPATISSARATITTHMAIIRYDPAKPSLPSPFKVVLLTIAACFVGYFQRRFAMVFTCQSSVLWSVWCWEKTNLTDSCCRAFQSDTEICTEQGIKQIAVRSAWRRGQSLPPFNQALRFGLASKFSCSGLMNIISFDNSSAFADWFTFQPVTVEYGV